MALTENGTDNEFKWRFHRIGGLDQVTLRTSEELRHLHELDPKLWVVLSCPIEDLQFDRRTLELLNTDGDGRIGVQEILTAVQWLTSLIREPAEIADRPRTLPTTSIRDDTPEGVRLLAAARQVLRRNGREEAQGELSQEEVGEAVETAIRNEFNGDGVIPLRPGLDAEIAAFINDVTATLGSVPEVSGEPGVDGDLAHRFMDQVRALHQWEQALEAASASLPPGDGTSRAFAAWQAVAEKIDDYFLRCDLAAYDPPSLQGLNPSADVFSKYAEQNLGGTDNPAALLPLSRIEAGRPLPLCEGLNPAWSKATAAFREQTVRPLLGDVAELNAEQWGHLKDLFVPYAEIVSSKPETAVEKLGSDRIAALADSDVAARFDELIERDLAAREDMSAVQDLERLVLYYVHLHRLLMNFVSFCDFYALGLATTFQIGRLYIDGRTCNVCVRVQDIEKHAAQAVLSGLCLLYCECTRKGRTDKINIAAAMTAGDANLLFTGRHGVFVDTSGEAWDAVLVRLVDNPISLRTAIWAPYRRLGRAVTQQVQKFAAEKQNTLVVNASKSLETIAKTPPPAAGKSFDIGRSMGIFAALGLAFGAIGTALASIANALLSLAWWQLPFVFVGLFLVVSGPSVFLAWIKLRKRTLGPVLDASGWAVNSQIPINLTMGNFLTGMVALPANAQRSFNDPFQKSCKWKKRLIRCLALALGAALAAGLWWGWQHKDTLFASEPVRRQKAAPKQQSAPKPAQKQADAAKPVVESKATDAVKQDPAPKAAEAPKRSTETPPPAEPKQPAGQSGEAQKSEAD